MKKLNLQTGILSIIILLAAFTRIMPHPPNFSPIAAIGLFGAAHFEKKWHAFFIPLLGIWLSDLVINNFIYASSDLNIVWFYNGIGNFWGWENGESHHDTVWVFFTDFGDQKSSHTGTCTTTQ